MIRSAASWALLLLAGAFLAEGAIAAPGREGAQRSILGPQDVPVEEFRSSRLTLSERPAGLSISTMRIIEQDGSVALKKGLIGTWPVAQDVNIGVGLIEVVQTSPRETPLRRVQPMKEVSGRTDRIAAVGVSVKF